MADVIQTTQVLPAQGFAGGQDVFLADDFIEGTWAHSGREGGRQF